MLDEAAVRAGYRLLEFDTLGSTNDEALARGRAGEPDKLWVVAGTQGQGRGRAGRTWSSPAGNLYASLLLVDPAESRLAPELGFVAGLALARAVSEASGVSNAVRIKWPNDLVFEGAKFAGVLVEGTQLPSGTFACVLGFGVNCVSHPSGLAYRTTDVSRFAQRPASSVEILKALSRSVLDTLAVWDRGRNFAGLREEWLRLALPKGAALTVRAGRSTTDGCFETIDPRGRLILNTGSGSLTIDAADVFLTGQGHAATKGKQGEA